MIENKEINRTFEKYPEYKDSGVDWLGEIPSHWEIKKMKFLGSIFPGLSGKKGDDFSKEFREDFKPFIPFTNICNNLKIDTDQYQYVHIAEFEVQNKVQKNDILFLMSSETLEDIGKCSLYDGKNKELYLNSFCKGFRFNSNKLSTYFVNYLLQGQIYRNYFSLVGRGFTRINLKQEYINDAPIVLPPLQEQTAIANFLDNKTSKIDTAIAQKEQMIALLKERKQIIIQNAVTGKWSMVDGKWAETPKEKMKDSGVEWIGEIPEHWRVKKLKHLGSIFPGLSGKKGDDFSKQYKEGLKPFIPFTNICNNLKISNKEFQFVDVGEFEKQNRVQKNDILFLMSSETLEDIGKCSLYDGENIEVYLNSFCKGFRFKSNRVSSYFINYLLQGEIYRNYFSTVGRGFTRINLKQEYINDLNAILPPLEEQTTIANFLDDKTSKIDQAITLQQSQIEKLKEYKSTLIDSAVTGKIKVTNE